MKIVSDGSFCGTHIFDDNGEELKYVSEIEIIAPKFDDVCRAKLTFVNVELELENVREKK